jgi:C-terminal processing protease CtpA/Prc
MDGDMIVEVNGRALTTVDAAMGMYATLKGKSRVTLRLQRKGKDLTKTLRVR